MRKLMLVASLALLAVPSAPTFAQTTADPVAESIANATFETRLPNGLRVIVKEDHRAPTAVHMVWYRIGSMDEEDGRSGVAHVLEHMMFKATKLLKSGEFNKRVAEAGGRDNAFTSRDYTAYFQIIPKAALPEMMALEADRMRNLKVEAKEFEAEIKVVMEERRWRTEDQPEAKVHEAATAAMYVNHPYRRPIIGWMADLKQMTWQDARDWYRRWYAPNNATVVVAGDVDHREVFNLAAKTYGLHQPMALPKPRLLDEPPQTGIRRITVKAPAKLPYLMMSWKAPAQRDVINRETYALDMLAAVLDGHAASRLPRELVRTSRVAQSVGAGYDGNVRGEASFVMDGHPAEGKTVADLEAALRGELKRVQDAGVSAEELARVRTQVIAAETYKKDSVMAQAMEIGQLEAVGLSWRDNARMLEMFKTVTPDEVQAVAKKYFGDDTLTVATLEPQPIDESDPLRRARPNLKH
jgi:zinc protease